MTGVVAAAGTDQPATSTERKIKNALHTEFLTVPSDDYHFLILR